MTRIILIITEEPFLLFPTSFLILFLIWIQGLLFPSLNYPQPLLAFLSLLFVSGSFYGTPLGEMIGTHRLKRNVCSDAFRAFRSSSFLPPKIVARRLDTQFLHWRASLFFLSSLFSLFLPLSVILPHFDPPVQGHPKKYGIKQAHAHTDGTDEPNTYIAADMQRPHKTYAPQVSRDSQYLIKIEF